VEDGAPWGIGAWQFLWLYWIAFALALVVVLAAAAHLRREAAAGDADTRPLGHYHLAWLAGGAPRVEEVVIAVLLASGRARIDDRGVLAPLPGAEPSDPVEHWLFQSIGTGRTLRGAGSLRFGDSQVGQELVGDLARRGHLRRGGAESPGRQGHWVLGVVLGIGVARLFAELDWQWQVGALLISLVLSGAVWLAVAFALRAGEDRPSDRGRAALAAVSVRVAQVEDLRTQPGWLPAAVAVEGIAAHPDPAVAELVAAHTRPGPLTWPPNATGR